MSLLLTAIILIAFAYLCGSVPFGYWAGKLHGIDIREHGSKNIGATNVVRVLGKKVGIPVFLLDMIKGALPVWLAEYWMADHGASANIATTVAVLCGVASVLGHSFTPWLQFKGGKGVATTAGVLLGMTPWALVIAFSVWFLVLYFSRYVALASICAAIAMPVAIAIMMTLQGKWNFVLLGFGILMGILVILRHRANIQRLLAGTENRFERKK